MLAESIVMFRESLEVVFVAGTVLTYLKKTKNDALENRVWFGVLIGILLSIGFAGLILYLKADFDRNEPLFEGIFMIITSILVTWMIIWMAKQKKAVESIHESIRLVLDRKETAGIFLLALSATLREGVEAVLFMAGIFESIGALSLLGGFLGIIVAIAVGFLVFRFAVRFNIGLFFKVTSVILVLLAAGLFSQAMHELQEAKVLPVWVEHVYDINPPLNPDGTIPALHDKGLIGSIFRGLIGYSGAPSDLQLIGYFAYLGAVYLLYRTFWAPHRFIKFSQQKCLTFFALVV